LGEFGEKYIIFTSNHCCAGGPAPVLLGVCGLYGTQTSKISAATVK